MLIDHEGHVKSVYMFLLLNELGKNLRKLLRILPKAHKLIQPWHHVRQILWLSKLYLRYFNINLIFNIFSMLLEPLCQIIGNSL